MIPTPITRKEQFLAKIAGADIEIAPITREEQFLAKIAGDDVPVTPITREEQFLEAIAENGGGGIDGVTWLPLNVHISGTLTMGNDVTFKSVFVGMNEGSIRMEKKMKASELKLSGEKLYFPVSSLDDYVFLQFKTEGDVNVSAATGTRQQTASGVSTGNTVWCLNRADTTASELNIRVDDGK